MKKSNAWGHNVRPLTDAEIQYQIESGKRWHQWQIEHPKYANPALPKEEDCIRFNRKCTISKKCENESTHMLSYRYVTGRQGRVSSAKKEICLHHAQKYLTTPTGDKQEEK